MLDAGQSLRQRVFVDRSVIETYANERLCLTGRIILIGVPESEKCFLKL
jgi:hypothetical protein